MKRPLAFVAAAVFVVAAAAHAALKPGDAAPDFKTQASLAGNVFTFSLADALKKGPVVLYFYPAAFTTGCTIEAHEFAEAVDAYRALGASVIGVSRDDIDTLNRFSVSECRSKFPVASDQDQSIMKSYDAVLAVSPSTRIACPMSSRPTAAWSSPTSRSIPRSTSSTPSTRSGNGRHGRASSPSAASAREWSPHAEVERCSRVAAAVATRRRTAR